MGVALRSVEGRLSRLLKCGLLLSGALAIPAAASVIVLGNYNTGEVVIQGNQPGGSEVERAVALAKGGTNAGWTQIYGPDDDAKGWGALLCVRHAKGVFFAEAIGEVSEAEARRTVEAKAERFLARLVDNDTADRIEMKASWPALAQKALDSGLATKVECAPPWNNQGQQIAFVGKALDAPNATPDAKPGEELAEKAPETKPADEAVEEPAADEAAKPADEAAAATTEVASSEPAPAPKRDYEAEYQERLREWQAQDAEHDRKVAEYEEATRQVEQDKIAQAERAKQAQQAYEQALDDRAAQAAAVADENRRREAAYEQQLARSGYAGAGPLIDFPEAVSVCGLDPNDLQSQFGNWKCVGPLQFTYAKLGAAGQAGEKALYAVRDSCGGKVEDVRDLGMVNGYHVFGCSFGINPDPKIRLSRDAARQFGLDYIDGRMLFRCPASKSGCRTR